LGDGVRTDRMRCVIWETECVLTGCGASFGRRSAYWQDAVRRFKLWNADYFV